MTHAENERPTTNALRGIAYPLTVDRPVYDEGCDETA